jgi:hypothetical protein
LLHTLNCINPKVDVCFSNPPFGVKHFQTIHHCSVDIARGLALLFGIGTKALPLWDSRTRRNNLWVGLWVRVAVRVTAGPSGHANSPHPSSREGHHSTARWSSSFLLSHVHGPARRDGDDEGDTPLSPPYLDALPPVLPHAPHQVDTVVRRSVHSHLPWRHTRMAHLESRHGE